MSLDLQVQTNAIPQGFCFNGFASSSWLDIVGLLFVRFPDDVSLFNFGSDTPAPDRRDRPWIRTNSDGTPDKMYVYAMGAWIARHPVAEGVVVMYEGTEGSIETFDGGEAGPATSISGQMWEKVDEMDARMPIGPGTLPSTTVLAVGDQGGEEKHALTSAENGPHVHENSLWSSGGTVEQEQEGEPDGPLYGNVNDSASSGLGTAHNNLPPYTAIFFIRKTARTYYRV